MSFVKDVMKKVNYAYDVLFSESSSDNSFCYCIRIKRYRLKSRYPLVSVAVSRQPIITDFSQLPDDYENLCVVCEKRLKYNLSLSEMKKIARQFLIDTFLQTKLDMQLDE